MSLDQATAIQRAGIIRPGSINYNYNIIILPTEYYGLAELNFYIDNLNFTNLKIDFTGKLIEEVVLNSRRFMPTTTENFMLLPKTYLQKGRNKLSVMYINSYNNDSYGCISFYDNDQQFVYTNFEPYGAHRVFPCFDQPDLKAKMKISIVTPQWWNVVSN